MCRVCERLSYDPLPDVPSENEDDNDYVPYRPYDVPVRSIRKQLIPIQIVVKPAPSHDGTPIFAAWEKPRIAQRGDWDYPSPQPKPPFGMAVYDITPTATPTRAAKMVHALSRRTMYRNSEWGRDRIEVVCFPLPSHLTCQERAKACISHHGHEVRNRAVIDSIDDAKFWFLPEDFSNEWYSRGIILIDRLEDTWEDAFDCDEKVIQYEDENTRSPFGSFATVYWLPREATWEYYEEEFRPEDRVNMQKYGLESIGRMLGREGIGNSIRGFYDHFTSDGVLDRELAVARTRRVDARQHSSKEKLARFMNQACPRD